MDKRISNYISWIKAIIAACFAAFGSDIYLWVTSVQVNKATAVTTIFVAALIAIQLTEFSLSYVVEHSQWLRKKIAGRHYIEGFWFDIAIAPEAKIIREFGLIEIDFEDRSYVVSGILFDPRYRRIGTFESHLSKNTKGKLEYAYSRRVQHEEMEEGSGLGEYEFAREKPYPLTFSGSFFDPKLDKRVLVKGLRIIDEKNNSRLSTMQLNDATEVVKELADKFFEEFPEYDKRRHPAENI